MFQFGKGQRPKKRNNEWHVERISAGGQKDDSRQGKVKVKEEIGRRVHISNLLREIDLVEEKFGRFLLAQKGGFDGLVKRRFLLFWGYQTSFLEAQRLAKNSLLWPIFIASPTAIKEDRSTKTFGKICN